MHPCLSFMSAGFGILSGVLWFWAAMKQFNVDAARNIKHFLLKFRSHFSSEELAVADSLTAGVEDGAIDAAVDASFLNGLAALCTAAASLCGGIAMIV